MIPHIVHWVSVADKLPDSDRTVLIHNVGWIEHPVWVGYLRETAYRGPVWRDADGLELNPEPDADPADAAPTHWAEMPAGPSQDN